MAHHSIILVTVWLSLKGGRVGQYNKNKSDLFCLKMATQTCVSFIDKSGCFCARYYVIQILIVSTSQGTFNWILLRAAWGNESFS